MVGPEVPGIDARKVSATLLTQIPGANPPFSFEILPGGRSNLTYLVSDATGDRWVLRRPPLGHVLPTAHDMAREFRVLSALHPTDVPVPRPIALCKDPEVTGQPFYVMEYCAGLVVGLELPAGALAENNARTRLSEAVIDTLAALHTVDHVAAGLEGFGRPEGFLERQLRRWSQQWEASETSPEPGLGELVRRLEAALPAPGDPGVVHGDYRLGNLVLDPEEPWKVRALLDWEMATVGDPLTDLGYLLLSWGQAGDPAIRLDATEISRVTAAPGFLSRQEMVARYAERTGRDVSGFDWYEAFAAFKAAVIEEGIYARYLKGETVGEGFDHFGRSARKTIELALDICEQSELPRLRGA